jgi:integral membrane protein (TIGR01906 family)
MKFAPAIARWLFILLLPVFLLTLAVGFAFNSRWLYEYGFKKYDIARVTGIAPAELNKAAQGLIGYFNAGGLFRYFSPENEFIDVAVVKDGQPFTLFNEREVEHLKDVKGLVWLDYKGLLGTGLFCLGYIVFLHLRRRPGYHLDLARAAFGGSLFSLGLFAFFGVIIATDFDNFFLEFHLVSFSNDFWLLDPSKDYLIMLFPQGFWYDAALLIAGLTLGLALLLGLGSWLYMRRASRPAATVAANLEK